MKNLVRGAAILSILSMFVVIIYAETQPVQTESTLAIATDSQLKIQNNISDTHLVSNLLKDQIETAVAETATEAEIGNLDLDSFDLDNVQTNGQKTAQKNDKKLVKKTVSVKAVGRGSFSATAYCLKGKTAMGHGVRRGIIAADPRVLKLGSTITIDAGPWSGTYLVSDTGGAIKGKKLDIWVPNCSEARKFGRRSVQVY